MAKATKAQRDYFAALIKKASIEDKELALKVAKEEHDAENAWVSIKADELDRFQWDKAEISTLISVLVAPEDYREEVEPEIQEEAPAMVEARVELTVEDIQEITEAPKGTTGASVRNDVIRLVAKRHGTTYEKVASAYVSAAKGKARELGLPKARIRTPRVEMSWAQEIFTEHPVWSQERLEAIGEKLSEWVESDEYFESLDGAKFQGRMPEGVAVAEEIVKEAVKGRPDLASRLGIEASE